MKQEELNAKLYELLVKIQNESASLIDRDISEEDAKFYEYLSNQKFVTNLKIEHYYSGPNINAESAIITDKGFVFINQMEQLNKPIRMNKENQYKQLQIFLERVEAHDKDLTTPNSRVKEADYFDLVKYAIDSNLVKGLAVKYASNKPYFFISQNIRVTTEGYEIMETPYVKEPSSISSVINNTYNLYDSDNRGASFGSNNTNNNNWKKD